MPAVNSQGSRAGLITGLVVFTILFVTSAIFAIYFNVQLQTTQKNFEDFKKTYNGVVAETAFQSPQFQALKALAGNGQTVLDVALDQRDQLAQDITGNPPGDKTDVADVAKKAKEVTLAGAAATLKNTSVAINTQGGLTSAVDQLASSIAAKQAQISDLSAQLTDAQKKLTEAQTSIAAENAKRDSDLADARAADAADLQKVQDQFKSNSDTVAQVQKDQADAVAKSQAAAQASQAQIADLQHQLAKLNDSLHATEARLGNRRMSVVNAAIRQADGKIIRIPGNNICYINLGQGDQVSPGLTFEVYDRATGIPPIPDNVTGDEQLPVGKASIEITHVGPVSSECRIVRTSPGTTLSEGDLIENLVYDPNTKYNFAVYGNFDLAETGRANAADAEVIKRLVTQWGGKVTDKVNIDTDFVVLGKEPELPSFSKEELDQPLNADKLAKAQDELDKYQQIVQTARELHIPILNQNRFLYYVGYYDQAKR